MKNLSKTSVVFIILVMVFSMPNTSVHRGRVGFSFRLHLSHCVNRHRFASDFGHVSAISQNQPASEKRG